MAASLEEGNKKDFTPCANVFPLYKGCICDTFPFRDLILQGNVHCLFSSWNIF